MPTVTIQQALTQAAQLYAAGQLQQAESICQQILAVYPNSAEALNLLAVIYAQAGRADLAIAPAQRAAELEPSAAWVHANLAEIRYRAGRYEEAVAAGNRAVQLDARAAAAWATLGASLLQTRKVEQAIEALKNAANLDPANISARVNLAAAYESGDRLEEAAALLTETLKLAPGDAAGHNNLGIVYCRQGRSDLAVASMQQAVAHAPENFRFHSHLIYTMLHSASFDPQAIFQAHRDWAQRHAEPLTKAAPPLEFDRDPERKLTIGYVSPNFRSHAVANFVKPIVENHDYDQFRVICYSTSDVDDGITQRFREHADVWRPAANLNDEQLAQQIRADRVDILVDLNGHIPNHRLLAFARRPAPVQVTYIGYQTTTGMSAMDYRVTDNIADPPGASEKFHTETLIRLPVFFCYSHLTPPPSPGPSPAQQNGYVTFGSMNNFVKVGPQVIALWARVLKEIPTARLNILIAGGSKGNQHVVDAFTSHGVDAARLGLMPMGDGEHYFRLFQQLDIALDPFPFSGHTTTCDALSMGVPVVTLAGQTYAGRMAASTLTAVGLTDWIAQNEGEYVQIAAKLASDPSRLADLRESLPGALAKSPAMDAASFTRELEAAYREMWRSRVRR